MIIIIAVELLSKHRDYDFGNFVLIIKTWHKDLGEDFNLEKCVKSFFKSQSSTFRIKDKSFFKERNSGYLYKP